MQKAFGHTLTIDFNHYDQQQKTIIDNLIQVVFHRALASSVGVKDGTFTSRAVTLVHPKCFLVNSLYLAHSTKHCKTSLTEYWGVLGGGCTGGGGCTVGQVTSRTNCNGHQRLYIL